MLRPWSHIWSVDKVSRGGSEQIGDFLKTLLLGLFLVILSVQNIPFAASFLDAALLRKNLVSGQVVDLVVRLQIIGHRPLDRLEGLFVVGVVDQVIVIEGVPDRWERWETRSSLSFMAFAP